MNYIASTIQNEINDFKAITTEEYITARYLGDILLRMLQSTDDALTEVAASASQGSSSGSQGGSASGSADLSFILQRLQALEQLVDGIEVVRPSIAPESTEFSHNLSLQDIMEQIKPYITFYTDPTSLSELFNLLGGTSGFLTSGNIKSVTDPHITSLSTSVAPNAVSFYLPNLTTLSGHFNIGVNTLTDIDLSSVTSFVWNENNTTPFYGSRVLRRLDLRNVRTTTTSSNSAIAPFRAYPALEVLRLDMLPQMVGPNGTAVWNGSTHVFDSCPRLIELHYGKNAVSGNITLAWWNPTTALSDELTDLVGVGYCRKMPDGTYTDPDTGALIDNNRKQFNANFREYIVRNLASQTSGSTVNITFSPQVVAALDEFSIALLTTPAGETYDVATDGGANATGQDGKGWTLITRA